MASIDAVHAGTVPAGPIPAIAVAAAPDAVPAGRARGRARGRGQARGRGRGRAQGRGRARPDNAAADADAEADEGSEADKSDSDAEADQADRWARGRNALRASRRRGLLQARRDQLARSSKTKLTISQAEVEPWIICSQMVMESEQRPEKKGHGNNGQTQLLCGPGFQMKMWVVGR